MFKYFLTDIRRKKWLFLFYIAIYSVVMIGTVVVMILFMKNYCNQSSKNPAWNIYSVSSEAGFQNETYNLLKKDIIKKFKNNIHGISGSGQIKFDNKNYICSYFEYSDINKFYSSKNKSGEGEVISSGKLYDCKKRNIILEDASGLRKGKLKIIDNTDLGVVDRREQAMNGEYTAISYYKDTWNDLQTSDTVIVDCSLEDKIKLMNNIDRKFGYTYDINDTLKYYYNNCCNIFKQESFYLLIAFTVLFVIGFCIHGILYLYNQKKEFAIYYLCGCTWKKSLYLSISRIFLLFAVAIPLGFLLLRLWRKFDTSLIGYVLKVQNEFFIFIGMMCLYLICCIPVFLIFGRMDTYDLFRKEEGI